MAAPLCLSNDSAQGRPAPSNLLNGLLAEGDSALPGSCGKSTLRRLNARVIQAGLLATRAFHRPDTQQSSIVHFRDFV